jgi:hypothetical protein
VNLGWEVSLPITVLPADKKWKIKCAVFQHIIYMQDKLHSQTDGDWPISDEWEMKNRNTATIIAVRVSN